MNKEDFRRLSKKQLILTSMLISLCGCAPPKPETSAEKTATIVARIVYVKDTYGICYATISTRTYGGVNAVSITTVPCKQVGLL